jgi:hypothetical protein
VGRATEESLFNSWQEQEFFNPSKTSGLSLGPTQPHVKLILRALSLEVKWLGHESDHSVASSAGVKNEWNCTFAPLTYFVA